VPSGTGRQKQLSHWSLDRVRKADEPEPYRLRPKFLSLQRADLRVIKLVMKSAAISATFSFVTALENFVQPPSKTYSSVPPSLAAPQYRNNSTDMAGIVSKRVVRIVARRSISGVRKTGPDWPQNKHIRHSEAGLYLPLACLL